MSGIEVDCFPSVTAIFWISWSLVLLEESNAKPPSSHFPSTPNILLITYYANTNHTCVNHQCITSVCIEKFFVHCLVYAVWCVVVRLWQSCSREISKTIPMVWVWEKNIIATDSSHHHTYRFFGRHGQYYSTSLQYCLRKGSVYSSPQPQLWMRCHSVLCKCWQILYR